MSSCGTGWGVMLPPHGEWRVYINWEFFCMADLFILCIYFSVDSQVDETSAWHCEATDSGYLAFCSTCCLVCCQWSSSASTGTETVWILLGPTQDRGRELLCQQFNSSMRAINHMWVTCTLKKRHFWTSCSSFLMGANIVILGKMCFWSFSEVCIEAAPPCGKWWSIGVF